MDTTLENQGSTTVAGSVWPIEPVFWKSFIPHPLFPSQFVALDGSMRIRKDCFQLLSEQWVWQHPTSDSENTLNLFSRFFNKACLVLFSGVPISFTWLSFTPESYLCSPFQVKYKQRLKAWRFSLSSFTCCLSTFCALCPGTAGNVEHGDQYQLKLVYEHNLQRTACSMTHGTFGGVSGVDLNTLYGEFVVASWFISWWVRSADTRLKHTVVSRGNVLRPDLKAVSSVSPVLEGLWS